MCQLIFGDAAVVLASHDLSAVRKLATKEIWIVGGKVIDYVEVGRTVDLCEKSFKT